MLQRTGGDVTRFNQSLRPARPLNTALALMFNRRGILIAILALTGLGAVAVLGLGISSLEPSARARTAAEFVLPAEALLPGVPKVLDVSGRPLVLLRPTDAQLAALKRLDSHVWDPSRSSYNAGLGAFVFWGVDTRRGCTVRYVPPGESVLVRISRPEAQWLGGFSSDICESAYDLAGRTIRTRSYSYNGFTFATPNLRSALVRRSGQQFVVSLHES